MAQVHDKLFETYFSWMTHVRLRARTTTAREVTMGSYTYRASDFGAANAKDPDAGAQWVCNAQLHRCMLFLLLWGEAANLRHAPECLCYLFYCTSNALLLTHPHYTAAERHGGPREEYPTADSPGQVAHVPEHFQTAREDEFLRCIVQPLYNFLKQEVLIRKEEPISQRSLYDDVNEAFWDRRR